MGELKKILRKSPLKIADEDHQKRKDISEKQFSEAIDELAEKFKQHEPAKENDLEHSKQMVQGTLDALNKE